MSLYIPPECQRFINVCSSTTVEWGYFQGGIVMGLFVALLIFYLWNKYKDKIKARE